MISQFFVLSPRGDTILAKQYRSASGMGAHERSHTEAFFRKIKFWDDVAESVTGDPQLDKTAAHSETNGGADQTIAGGDQTQQTKRSGDAPPVFKMPDGQTYFNVRRNGVSTQYCSVCYALTVMLHICIYMALQTAYC